jgi:flagellar hook assembly protein FlgD
MYSVTWDGKDVAGTEVPAGIYVVTLKTGDKVFNCKIIRP